MRMHRAIVTAADVVFARPDQLNRRAAKAPEQVSRWAREAADLRAFALRHAESDRGFAADLYAAADRHEAAGRAPEESGPGRG